MSKAKVPQGCRLKDFPIGVKFVFEEDANKQPQHKKGDVPATYARVGFDNTCAITSNDHKLDVPIIPINWDNDPPIGKVRYVSGERVVITMK